MHVDGMSMLAVAKPDGPPPPVARHDGAGQGKGTAQEILGRFHVAHLDETADDGAADGCRPARPFEEGQATTGMPYWLMKNFHGLRIACRLGTIGKVRADDDGRRMDVGQEVLADSSGDSCKRVWLMGRRTRPSMPTASIYSAFWPIVARRSGSFFRTQYGQRMGRKGDDHGFHTAGSGPFDGRLHDHLVAPVDAVKVPRATTAPVKPVIS